MSRRNRFLPALRRSALILAAALLGATAPPARAQAPCDYRASSAGATHTLLLRGDGTVYATGDNYFGQLGDGTLSVVPPPPGPPPSPDAVQTATGVPLAGVVAVAAGGWHSLALRSDGTVWSWGSNAFGELGRPTIGPGLRAEVIPTLSAVVAIATGSHHALALLADGRVAAWGDNAAGQLGDGTTVSRAAPVPVMSGGVPLQGVIAVAAGHAHSMALLAKGTVVTWGHDSRGQLGCGGSCGLMAVVPQAVVDGLSSPLVDIVAISAGATHSLALRHDGTVFAWGWNEYGQLGIAGPSLPAATQVTTLANVKAIAAGGKHSLALLGDGTVQSFGQNAFGQLGDGSVSGGSVPTTVRDAVGIPIGKVFAIAAGSQHSVLITADSKPLAFGSGRRNELGNGTLADRSIPGEVSLACKSGCYGDLVALSVGNRHTLALRSDGTVLAGGSNDRGQLGDGFTSTRLRTVLSPARIGGAIAVAAGGGHSLALLADGTVQAWGDNTSGQLGNGTTVRALVPVAVVGLDNVIAIDAGENYSLALTSDGQTWAWGSNSSSVLGCASCGLVQLLPTPSATGGAKAISAGISHALALLSSGTVMAWGSRSVGQVGDSTCGALPTSVPRVVLEAATTAPLDGIKALAAGGVHSLALRHDGTVHGWGLNSVGQLGDGSPTVCVPRATESLALPAIRGLSCGIQHSLVHAGSGGVHAFGANAQGQLGNGSTVPSAVGVVVTTVASTALAGVSAVAAGMDSSLALDLDGAAPDAGMMGWGSNTSAQLGIGAGGAGTERLRATPALPPGCTTGLATRDYSGIVLRDGQLWSWGFNAVGGLGLLGTGSNLHWVTSPEPVLTSAGGPPFDEVGLVFAGHGTTLAIRRDHTLWSWGINDHGELGRTGAIDFPGQVGTFTNVTTAAGGGYHSLFVDGGIARSMGYNSTGQLGNGTTIDSAVPVTVAFPPGTPAIIAVAGGSYHSVAVDATGRVWSWGWNTAGQLGLGHTSNRSTPQPVSIPGSPVIVAVAAGEVHSLAMTSSGAVWAWGSNQYGQLGDGTATNRTSPVAVTTLSKVAEISAGYIHSTALLGNGTMRAWGYNHFGQLGVGTPMLDVNRTPLVVPSPVTVTGIAAGRYHTHAVQGLTLEFGSGQRREYQLGNGFGGPGSPDSPVYIPIPF